MFWVVLVGSERQLCISTDRWGAEERNVGLLLLKYLERSAPQRDG